VVFEKFLYAVIIDMEGFTEYIINFAKYPKTAKTEVFVRYDFNSILHLNEECIELTTKETIEQIYDRIKGITCIKDPTVIILTQTIGIFKFKIKRALFKRDLYIGIKKYKENKYFVVCEYSENDIRYWNENIARTQEVTVIPRQLPVVPFYKRLLQRANPHKPRRIAPDMVPSTRGELLSLIPKQKPKPTPKPKPTTKPNRIAPYMVQSTSRELSPLIPKKKPDPKKPKSKSSSRSKSSSSHSSIELLTNSSSSSSRKAKK